MGTGGCIGIYVLCKSPVLCRVGPQLYIQSRAEAPTTAHIKLGLLQIDKIYLGVIFDSGNTFSNHITNMCRACYYHLKDLRRIRKFLSVETAALLANSMISSRLDYCNSLLYGISKYNVAKLQKIQNALCRIVFRLDRTSHVTPFLQKLHWLPITYRILFKYNLITFKAINFSQPIYLSSLIKTSCLTRGNRLSLSSASHKKAIGRRGFVVASPIEWNRLPQSVRSQQTITGFRSQLKTYLFRLAYPPP